jgi:hypothetical protein
MDPKLRPFAEILRDKSESGQRKNISQDVNAECDEQYTIDVSDYPMACVFGTDGEKCQSRRIQLKHDVKRRQSAKKLDVHRVQPCSRP